MDDVALSLACCIVRAEKVSRDLGFLEITSNNYIYWHTREVVAARARAAGIKWQIIVSTYNGLAPYCSSGDPGVISRSAPYWYDVAHPEVILREVMES